MRLANARVVLADRVEEGDVVLRDGRIEALAPPGSAPGWDLEGRTVAPGLFDPHTHGGWGIDFTRDDILAAVPHYARAGVTRLLVTLYPGPPAETLERVAVAAKACAASPALAGIHLEGPFLAREKRGALPEAGILPYDADLMQRILDAARGELEVMTFAPEGVPLAEVRKILAAGVALSIGHTVADAAATRAAIAAGVRRATHLCNAMPAIHHRAPGPVVPLLLERGVDVELIVDGFHLDDEFVRLVLEVKGPDGVIAISDSTPFAGLGPAEAHFAGGPIVSDGRRVARPDGTLAGSATTLFDALTRLQAALDLPEHVRWALGAGAPIAPGAPADLVVLDADGSIAATLRDGERADEMGELPFPRFG